MAKKRAPAKRRPRKAKAGTRGLTPAETRLDELTGSAREVAERVESAGGRLLGSYSDPLGKQPVLVAILPIDSVEPTPFQRDLSQVHHRKLADVLDRTGMFLDPIIAVTAPEKGFWTPNGMHRLMAMRRLGARSITALVVPKREIAWQILALNTEKAHNLREKSLETIRMARALAGAKPSSGEDERAFAFEFEQPAFLTLGAAYDERGRLSGGAYQPILRRVDDFLDEPMNRALKERERRGRKILALDDAVSAVVEKLKAKGLTSPYLKPFVVARVNSTRFSKATSFDFDETLDKIIASAKKFNTEKVNQQDVVKAGGGAPPEED
jgi:ParB family chromosome partitioning protein